MCFCLSELECVCYQLSLFTVTCVHVCTKLCTRLCRCYSKCVKLHTHTHLLYVRVCASVCMWSACGRLSVTMVTPGKAYLEGETWGRKERVLSLSATWGFLLFGSDSLTGFSLISLHNVLESFCVSPFHLFPVLIYRHFPKRHSIYSLNCRITW